MVARAPALCLLATRAWNQTNDARRQTNVNRQAQLYRQAQTNRPVHVSIPIDNRRSQSPVSSSVHPTVVRSFDLAPSNVPFTTSVSNDSTKQPSELLHEEAPPDYSVASEYNSVPMEGHSVGLMEEEAPPSYDRAIQQKTESTEC